MFNRSSENPEKYESLKLDYKELIERNSKALGWVKDMLKEHLTYCSQIDLSITSFEHTREQLAERIVSKLFCVSCRTP